MKNKVVKDTVTEYTGEADQRSPTAVEFSRRQRSEVALNFKAFKKQLPGLLANNLENKFALMHNRKAIEFFDDFHEAMVAGRERYPGQNFSVQEVTDKPIDMPLIWAQEV